MAMQSQSRPDGGLAGSAAAGAVQGGSMSSQNLNQIIAARLANTEESRLKVIEYLSKKGYTRTEAMLRTESASIDADGRPIPQRAEHAGDKMYNIAMELLISWIEGVLDIYKPELRRLLWPVFVYSFLDMVSSLYSAASKDYFEKYKGRFENEHRDDVRKLEPIGLPEHVQDAEIAKIYRGSKYRLTISKPGFFMLIQFLEQKEKDGGSVILRIIQSYMQLITVDRAAEDKISLANMLARSKTSEDFPAEDEGIPGHNPGSANLTQEPGSNTLTRLKLGPLPMEAELLSDVMAELEEEDAKNPPPEGRNTLAQEFDHMIKKEDSDESPSRNDVPLPPSKARDVLMEVHKVKENRDRFRIETRTGGLSAGVSVCMFTFHNTYDSVTCVQLSDDNKLIAIGMDQHYIRVWNVDGKPLPSQLEGEQPSASRRLVGHSGPVYNVSFSPSISNPEGRPSDDETPSTASQMLLSCSADKTIRLWHLGIWQCLVVYKGHFGPVWDVTWGPFGHYFLTGSHDKTARLWSTENISHLRMFVGHDQDVDCVTFHPNNAYVFTGSSDRMVRMWAVVNAFPVRMFTGHTGNITALACSPSGKLLASADDIGTIILWDLAPGKLLKRMRGHGRGGIWSLSWSVESNVLISGGMDGTVRLWDVAKPVDAPGQGKVVGEGGAGAKIDAAAGAAGQSQSSVVAPVKKKGKEVVVSSDQIGAFPTKKSPVYKVKFTRMNLAIAAGSYLP